MTRYAENLAVGDGVLIWMSGEKAGIYAIAEVIEPASVLDKQLDLGYWLDRSLISNNSPQARIRFTNKLLNNSLLKDELKQDSVLKDLQVIRQPNATNYKVTPEEWKLVYELKNNHHLALT